MQGRFRNKGFVNAAPWLWWLVAIVAGLAAWQVIRDAPLGFADVSLPKANPKEVVLMVPGESPWTVAELAKQWASEVPLDGGGLRVSAQGPLDDYVRGAGSKSDATKGGGRKAPEPTSAGNEADSEDSSPAEGVADPMEPAADSKEDWAEASEAESQATEGLCNDIHPNADDPNMLHVVFASDLNQVEGVQASVTSVVTSAATPDLLTVHIMVRAMWAKDFKKAFGLRPECLGAVTVTGVLIRVHEVSTTLIERSLARVAASVKKERGALDTLENFARFYMHLVLERESVVVYLDADTIVQADLGQLRQKLLASGRTVGFVAREQKVLMEKFLRPKPKNCVMKSYSQIKNLSGSWNSLMKKQAYNVGVFAVDLRRWKMTGAVERVEQLVQQHNSCGGALWVGGSQPPLLLAFHHRPKDAPQDYIVFDAAWNVGDLGWRDKMNRTKLKTKNVLHWNGNRKPWQSDGLYKDLWRPHREAFSSLLQPYESGDSDTASVVSGASDGKGEAAIASTTAPSKDKSERRRRRTTTTMSPEEAAERAKCPYVDMISEWAEPPCNIGRTYGCTADNRSMWVKLGCSGAFLVHNVVTACPQGTSRESFAECKPGTLPVRSAPCGLMILTTFFTTKKDWQRGKFAKAQFDKIKKLYVSAMKHSLRVTVVYDDLPQELLATYTTPLFQFHRVNLSDYEGRYGVNDVRYFFFNRLVKEHKDWTSVFIVDAFDVRIGMDMCSAIKDNMLYLGIELDKLKNHPWMKARFMKMGGKYKQWYEKKVDPKMKILNCGITGGKRDVMLKLLRRMGEVITDPELAPNRKGEDVNLNMAALNYIVYTEFANQYTGNPPVHSLYKRFQNKRNDVWFIHK